MRNVKSLLICSLVFSAVSLFANDQAAPANPEDIKKEEPAADANKAGQDNKATAKKKETKPTKK